MKEKRTYHKSILSHKRRGVPAGDKRWEALFDFLQENKFTMQDMLACVCGVMINHNQGYFETNINFGTKNFTTKITNDWRIK